MKCTIGALESYMANKNKFFKKNFWLTLEKVHMSIWITESPR